MVVCRNLNYWDSVSTLAGEVPNPAKTFPRALFGAVILVTTTYALPLIVGLGVTTDIADWKLGYFASLAKQVNDTQDRPPGVCGGEGGDRPPGGAWGGGG